VKHFFRRIAVCLGIVALAWLIALICARAPLLRDVVQLGDNAFYDAFYRLRPVDSQLDGPVVIVAADDKSLEEVDKGMHFGWPWPREFWGHITEYAQKCGAKAVVLDLIFDQTSVYQNSTGDDDTFVSIIGALKTPVVFGSLVEKDGTWDHFAPAATRPTFGAVNVGNDVIYRQYDPQVYGKPSVAVAAVIASGQQSSLPTDQPFLLHYYGPHKTSDGKSTFRFVSASHVLATAMAPGSEKQTGISPDWFKDKIVLVGAVTAGTYDLKASPLSSEYPGVEVQATAIQNLLSGQAVRPIPPAEQAAAALVAAAITAVIVVFPRSAPLKMLGPILAAGGIVGIGADFFVQHQIEWLAPTAPLIAVAVAAVSAFGWTYFAEDRQRKFMLKALSKVVSPAVAQELAREPGRLALGTVRTRVTLLFTDLANFTTMSESIDVQKLGELLNRYLGEMSDQVLLNGGTLDKYIGDAIMCFWNAPLPQDDHAVRACRTALAIAQREELIREELRKLGAHHLFTRIGINTTDAAVGFVGSSHLFNYTALGDGVNLASRLEGANKLYSTRILLAQSTAEQVTREFLLRKVDLLKVKGKTQPMAVFELMGEKGKDPKLEELAAGYQSALIQYQAQKWDSAEKELLELQKNFAEDGPIKALLARIDDLRSHPPPPDWDGCYEAKEK
jgi:adenylate cyclase